jgi:hypothetical protein
MCGTIQPLYCNKKIIIIIVIFIFGFLFTLMIPMFLAGALVVMTILDEISWLCKTLLSNLSHKASNDHRPTDAPARNIPMASPDLFECVPIPLGRRMIFSAL